METKQKTKIGEEKSMLKDKDRQISRFHCEYQKNRQFFGFIVLVLKLIRRYKSTERQNIKHNIVRMATKTFITLIEQQKPNFKRKQFETETEANKKKEYKTKPINQQANESNYTGEQEEKLVE